MSSVTSAAAGHVHQNSSAHVGRSGHLDAAAVLAPACRVCAAVLVHVARRRRLDSDLDERSFKRIQFWGNFDKKFGIQNNNNPNNNKVFLKIAYALHVRDQKSYDYIYQYHTALQSLKLVKIMLDLCIMIYDSR